MLNLNSVCERTAQNLLSSSLTLWMPQWNEKMHCFNFLLLSLNTGCFTLRFLLHYTFLLVYLQFHRLQSHYFKNQKYIRCKRYHFSDSPSTCITITQRVDAFVQFKINKSSLHLLHIDYTVTMRNIQFSLLNAKTLFLWSFDANELELSSDLKFQCNTLRMIMQ